MGAISNQSPAALDRHLRESPQVLSARRALLACASLMLLAICWRAAEVRPALLFRQDTFTALAAFAAGMFPPDVSPEFLRTVAKAIAQTIAVAVAGTFLSLVIAAPSSVLATATLWREGILAAGERHGAAWFLMATVTRLVRAVLGFLRAVPDLVWALMFVTAVGLGSLAGTLALGVAYSGVLGRVYADVFESVDPQPLEALQSTGATRTQIFLRGIWPQALPNVTAYTLYSFECCVRAASVLGFVGAGGIGYEINLSMRLFEYRQVLTLILAIVALLGLTDAISRYCRQRLLPEAARLSISHRSLALPYSEALPDNVHVLQPADTLRRRMALLKLALAAVIVAGSLVAVGFTPEIFLSSSLVGHIAGFFRQMIPPSLETRFVGGLGILLLQTIAISVIGTLIGIMLGWLLAIPATSTLALLPADSPGLHSRVERGMRWAAYASARLALNFLRSIPELVWVLICILAVGIGPFAGVIAISWHTAGVLGKLYAETMEEAPRRAVDALQSMGARPLQVLLWAIWPQTKSMLGSYTVLRWEMNLRVSTILGLVGGGGLGQAIYNNVQLGFYQRVGTLILLIYLLVIGTDWISGRLRGRTAEA